jgi:hypothetical protein
MMAQSGYRIETVKGISDREEIISQNMELAEGLRQLMEPKEAEMLDAYQFIVKAQLE